MATQWKEGERGAKERVRATQEQIRLRIQQIYAFLRDGQRTSDIHRLCAAQRSREAQARAQARIEGKPEPVLVWGDDELPSIRQLDSYIAKAKTLIAAEGRALSTKGEYVLGANYARVLDVYSRALTDKKYHAALRAIEVINRMFGLEGVVKVQLLPPTEGESAEDAAKREPKRIAAMTRESAFAALNEMMRTALARAQAAGHLEGVSTEQLLLGEPVKVVDPSTNGDKR